ncbi:hypothetical protein BD311DRAFT_372957 [Dichomitus squalens]|uniref:Uncharacterized protein n=1 Tax=Dichomitus squalens TaxID=114155 RepID=A0A4Q9MKT9_9APHY|nr:hypothetical protein BD311DRAFT_372957 [Dichomitus squalens]
MSRKLENPAISVSIMVSTTVSTKPTPLSLGYVRLCAERTSPGQNGLDLKTGALSSLTIPRPPLRSYILVYDGILARISLAHIFFLIVSIVEPQHRSQFLR